MNMGSGLSDKENPSPRGAPRGEDFDLNTNNKLDSCLRWNDEFMVWDSRDQRPTT